MQTLFSHIVQKRYSQSYEDIATDALAYILNTHETSRQAMMQFLRNIEPSLPDLTYNTQMTEGAIRPDMWGYSGNKTFLYVEDKFWAGLTENQPVNYLLELEKYNNPTLLLMIVPGAREQTMIMELLRRINEAGICFQECKPNHKGIVWQIQTEFGPLLTLTSWPRIIEIIKIGSEGHADVKEDIRQLQSLCDAADIDKFVPFDASDLSNQLTPAIILQLGHVIRDVGTIGLRKGYLSKDGLTTGATFSSFGGYYWLNSRNNVGIWFGVDYDLWKTYGSPLWLKFSATPTFGRASEISALLKIIPEDKHLIQKLDDGSLVLSINLQTGSDKDIVVYDVAKQVEQIAQTLSSIPLIEE